MANSLEELFADVEGIALIDTRNFIHRFNADPGVQAEGGYIRNTPDVVCTLARLAFKDLLEREGTEKLWLDLFTEKFRLVDFRNALLDLPDELIKNLQERGGATGIPKRRHISLTETDKDRGWPSRMA